MVDLGRFNIGKQLAAANKLYSPIAGKLWSGTPISNKILGAGTVKAAESSYKPSKAILPTGPRATVQPVPYTPQPSGGGINYGGGGGGGQSNAGGGGQQDFSNLTQTEPEYDAPDFDSMIDPIIKQADQDITDLTAEFETYKTGATQQGKTAKEQEQQYYTGKETALGGQKETQTRLAESAADQARRQFSEITQGIQSRYGGTTGTGAFAESVAGGQAVQKLAEIKQGISQTIKSIDDKILEVREMGKLALQDIIDKTQAKIDDAKSNLDAQLREIRNRKGELQANKAQMAYTAMQDYKNMIGKIRSDNQTFLQNVYMKQVESENALKLKRTQAATAAESFTYFVSPELQGQIIGVGNKTGNIRTTEVPGGGKLKKIGTEKEDLATQLENVDLSNL